MAGETRATGVLVRALIDRLEANECHVLFELLRKSDRVRTFSLDFTKKDDAIFKKKRFLSDFFS